MRESLESGWSDVRYAIRGIRRNPGFTAAVVATLALGIGAAASIFAVVDALLLRPMPYLDAERWVEVNQARDDGGYASGLWAENAIAWREADTGVLDAWIAFSSGTVVRTDGAQAEALRVVAVSPGAERLLGIPLLLGRGFTADDARPGTPPVAILGRAYWERLGGDAGVIGRTIRLETGPATVVGVLAGGVRFPEYGGEDTDLWLPLRDDFTWADRDPGGAQRVWARLATGVHLAAAQERADVVAAGMAERRPSERTWNVRLVRVGDHRANPDVEQAIWTVAATVSAIFLIALVNGVNLLLVRGTARSRELTVRMALGGSRRRILRQLLVEGVATGLLGGTAAVALAWSAVEALRGILPSEVLYFTPHAFMVEGRTLLFVLLTSLAAGTLLGLLPGLQVLRHPARSRGLMARRHGDGPTPQRVRDGLVVLQVALSMALLVAAGLFLNSTGRLLRVDPGFDHERVAFARLGLSPTRYPDGATRADFVQRLERALQARPEIQAVTTTAGTGFSFGAPLQAEGGEPRDEGDYLIPHTSVADDYFSTTGTQVVSGRGLTASDGETDNVVVDTDLASFLWGNESAVGRRFRIGDGEWMTVVGVVRELRLMGRDQREGPAQFLTARSPEALGQYVEVAMRTRGDPEALLPVFRSTLRGLDPEQWIWKLHTGAQALAEEEDTPRFLVTLVSLLAGIAATLAAVGLYGVLSYAVQQRRRELGVRLALGADVRQVRSMVLIRGTAMAGVGVGLGLMGAYLAADAVGALLYELNPRDPTTFVAAGGFLLAVAVLASLIPARRATRVDPAEVLREE